MFRKINLRLIAVMLLFLGFHGRVIGQNDTGKVNRLLDQAWKIRSFDLDSAIMFASSSLELLNKIDNSHLPLHWKEKLTTRAFHYLGSFYSEKGEIDKPLSYFSKALDIANSINDLGAVASINGGLGTLYLNRGNFTRAMEHYFKALKISEKQGNKEGVSVRLSNIGTVYDRQGNYNKALEYYKKAIKILEQLKDSTHLAIQLGNIGIVYYEQKDLAKALEYHSKALAIDLKQEKKNGISRNLNNIGNIYKDQNDLVNAQVCFSEGLQLALEQGNKDLIATHTGNLGILFRMMKEYKKSEEYLLRAIALSEEIGSAEAVSEFESELSNLYAELGKYKLALDHFKKHISERDSIFNQLNTEKSLSLEMNYDFEKRQAIEKTRHGEQILLLEAENKTQKQFRLFLFVIIGLALLILFVVKRAYDNKKRLAEILATESDHKETLLQEVHHRINNNFQIISSLLTIQANTSGNEKLRLLLMQSQGRIQSLSTLHELLYQKHSHVDINMRQYLDKVLDFHREVLSSKPFEVFIHANVSPVIFSTRLAVPIALIVNELVTNSMKYAFNAGDSGSIEISLLPDDDVSDKWYLKVSDNGKGMNPEGNVRRDSMGLRLVNMMAKQIKANMVKENAPGASFVFDFLVKSEVLQATK